MSEVTFPQFFVLCQLFVQNNLIDRYLTMTFRSEEMAHFQLIIPREIAWEATNELGRLGCIHLEDIANPIVKPFTSQVKRCDEALHRIQAITSFMKKKGILPESYQERTDQEYTNALLQKWDTEAKKTKINGVKRIDVVEAKIEEGWNSYQELTSKFDRLNSKINMNKGKMAVFAATGHVLGASYFGARGRDHIEQNVGGEDDELGMNLSGLSYFVSIVNPEEEQRIAKMVFRVSRGYAWSRVVHSQTFRNVPQLRDFKESVLFLFYPNSSQGIVQRKLKRIIESFSIETFELPNSFAAFESERNRMEVEYEQIRDLFAMLNKQIDNFLKTLRSKSSLDEWKIFLTKEKLLYEGLNKMAIKDQFLTAHFYIPVSKRNQLLRIGSMSPSPIFNELPLKKCPSYFETNLFTYPGQQIVETYGVPRYGEMNPGVFTCVTFPFLFGVMFGDIAHGLVLLSFGLFLVFWAEKLRGTFFDGMLRLRYMVAMMGLFALYCGFIYNDFMGLGLNLFGSCYDVPLFGPGQSRELSPKSQGCVYPVGVDPVWYRSENQLMFLNSLKMKIAVIIGVIHMTFGIVLKAVNSIHFKKKLDLYFEFIPQLIFMVLLFGYMDFLIVFKWLKHWDKHNSSDAPSIITTLINLPLKLGKTTYQLGGMNMWGKSPDDTSQNSIQLLILLISVICIPVMLVPKPIIEISRMKKHTIKRSHIQEQLLSERESQVTQEFESLKLIDGVEEAHEDPGEIIVHQIIETIEYVLGCISNTASYLRLWALSLAHSQLARVFFSKTIQSGFSEGYSGITMLLLGFYLLAYVTFGVLMCMDTMECFLHALRLHWVEFQNKFFKADGIKFVPFSFRLAVQEMKEKQE